MGKINVSSIYANLSQFVLLWATVLNKPFNKVVPRNTVLIVARHVAFLHYIVKPRMDSCHRLVCKHSDTNCRLLIVISFSWLGGKVHLPVQETTRSIPDLRDPTCHKETKPFATAMEPALCSQEHRNFQSPGAAAAEAGVPRARAPQLETTALEARASARVASACAARDKSARQQRPGTANINTLLLKKTNSPFFCLPLCLSQRLLFPVHSECLCSAGKASLVLFFP